MLPVSHCDHEWEGVESYRRSRKPLRFLSQRTPPSQPLIVLFQAPRPGRVLACMRRVEGQRQLFGEIAWYSILWASDSHIDGILKISQIQAIEGRKTGRHKRSAKVVPIDKRMRSCRKETVRIVEKCLVATETGVHALWAGQFSESYPPSLGKPRQAGRVSSLSPVLPPRGPVALRPIPLSVCRVRKLATGTAIVIPQQDLLL